eukprot:tig00020571_g11498.t1
MRPLTAVNRLMAFSQHALQEIHRDLAHFNIPADQADDDERADNAQALAAYLRQQITGMGGYPSAESYANALPSIIGCNLCYSMAGETAAEASLKTQLVNPAVVVLNCEPESDDSSSASTISYALESPSAQTQRTALAAAEDWRASVASELARRNIFLAPASPTFFHPACTGPRECGLESERSLPAFTIDPLLPAGRAANGRRVALAQTLAGYLHNLFQDYCDPSRPYGVLANPTSAVLREGDHVLTRLVALGRVPLADLLLGALTLLIEISSSDAFDDSPVEAFHEAILSLRQFGVIFDPDLNISELSLFLPSEVATSLHLFYPDFPLVPSKLWAAITHARTPARRSLMLLHYPFRAHHDRGDFIVLVARASDLIPDPPTHSQREAYYDRKFRTENFSARLKSIYSRLLPCLPFGILADPENLPYILLFFPKAAYSMLPPPAPHPLTSFSTPFHSCDSYLPSPHPPTLAARPRLLPDPKAKDYADSPATVLWELFGSEGDRYLPPSPGLLAALICHRCISSDSFYQDPSWLHPAHTCPAE